MTEINKEGTIINCKYVFIVMDKDHLKMISKLSYTPDELNGKIIPSGANGAIIVSDLKNNNITSIHFENGKIDKNKSDKLIYKFSNSINRNSSGEINYSNLDPYDIVCTQWYWNTYINGELVNSVYVGETCTGGGIGGGGGNVGENGNAQELFDFISMGVVESGEPNVTTTFNDGTEWNVTYDWIIYTAGTWGLLSYEDATLRKIHYPNYSRWEYQTFTHRLITDFGANVGGTRTFEDLGPTINNTPTHQTAWVRIDFKVIHSVTGFVPLPIAYNANKTFFAP